MRRFVKGVLIGVLVLAILSPVLDWGSSTFFGGFSPESPNRGPPTYRRRTNLRVGLPCQSPKTCFKHGHNRGTVGRVMSFVDSTETPPNRAFGVLPNQGHRDHIRGNANDVCR
jgi:hypothetical protein